MASNGQMSSEDAEVRNALRAFAGNASPTAAFNFSQRFMHHLKEALQAGSQAQSSAAECSSFEFVVRGAGGATEPEARWVIHYRTLADGTVAGTVVDSRESADGATASSSRSRVEFVSFKDILDLVTNRRAATSALLTRRVKMSGDVMSAMKTLAPMFKSAAEQVAKEIPNMLEMSEDGSLGRSQSVPSLHAGHWMDDSASLHCLICGLPWRPIIRQRHHCRSCGILVCGKCSTLQVSGVRQCSSCVRQCGSTSFSSAFPVNRSMVSDNASFRRATSMINPEFSPSMASSALPEPPSVQVPTVHGSEIHGVLYAQVNAVLSKQLMMPVPAALPSESEQRLWERVQSLQKSIADLKAPAVWTQVLNSLVSAMLRLLLCAAVLVSFSVAEEDVPIIVYDTWKSIVAWLPTVAPKVLVFVAWTAIVTMFLSTRWVLVLTIATIFVHKWFGAMQLLKTLTSLNFSIPANLLIIDLFTAHPIWTCICCASSLAILCSNRSLGRLISIYSVASVPISIYWSCKIVSGILRLSEHSKAWLYGKADLAMAPFITNRFLALGGLFVKMGQWVSNASSFAPVAFIEHLQKLVDDAPYDSDEHVRASILSAFGKTPEELFEDFEMHPLASASIAQVHRAKLCTGKTQTIAVKLQHEGIAPLMLSDLKALTRIIRFCCWLGGEEWTEAQKVFDSWAKEMVKELDFEYEVANLQEVRAGTMAAGVDVVVPREIESLRSKSAFAMEFCEGFRFTDRDRLALHGVDRKALGARVLHAAACQLLEIGLFNSDPHAGNILCQVRGTTAIPVLLDFGNCIRLAQDRRIAYCNLIIALSEASVTKAREALDMLGLVTTQSTEKPERDMEYMLLMFRDTGARSKRQKEAKEFYAMRKEQREMDYQSLGATTKKEKKKVKKQVQRYPKQSPDEFVLFTRMILLVQGLCMQLEVELPLLQIFESHARRALIGFYPLPQRALSLLPAAARSGQRHSQQSGAYEQTRKRIVAAICDICSDRPGVGVQVCVWVGDSCIIDECGGVLGSVDPRPMERDTPIPLADLSRLPLLLAILKEYRAKHLSYNKPIDAAATTPTLRDVLTHRAFAARGDGRAALASVSAGTIKNGSSMQTLTKAALAEEPLCNDQARYLPVGAGYVAAPVLQASQDNYVRALLQLPGMDVFGPREIGYGIRPESSPCASLSCTLFADFRAMMASSGLGVGFLGTFKPPANDSGSTSSAAAPLNGAHSENGTHPSPTDEGMPRSIAFSILEAAGGLLVDPALAMVAVNAATQSLQNGPANVSSVCPDLAVASSARALAAVLAASKPATNMSTICAREPTSRGMFDALGFVQRTWDERGFEIFLSEDGGSSAAAIGLTAAHGLLGAAVQYPSNRMQKATTTVVVLSNEISLTPVPSKLIREICSCMGLPQLINFLS